MPCPCPTIQSSALSHSPSSASTSTIHHPLHLPVIASSLSCSEGRVRACVDAQPDRPRCKSTSWPSATLPVQYRPGSPPSSAAATRYMYMCVRRHCTACAKCLSSPLARSGIASASRIAAPSFASHEALRRLAPGMLPLPRQMLVVHALRWDGGWHVRVT